MRPALRIATVFALVVLSAAAGWALRGDQAPPAAPRDGPDRSADDAQGLAACREKLVRREVELRAAQKMAARALSGDVADQQESPEPAPVGSGVKAHDGREWVDVPDPALEARRQGDVREQVGTSLARELELSEEDEAVAKDLICSMRANQRSLFSEFSEGRLPDEALWRALGEERATMSEGLRRTLGAERMARLQDLGGIPIWSQTMCQRR